MEYFERYDTQKSEKGNWAPGLSGFEPIKNIPIILKGKLIKSKR